MIKRYIFSYEEKMIMKSMKDQSINRLDILKKYIKTNSSSLSHDDIIEAINIFQKEIRHLKVYYK